MAATAPIRQDGLLRSRRTAQIHVAYIFMKPGFSSRARLAAEVIRQPGRA